MPRRTHPQVYAMHPLFDDGTISFYSTHEAYGAFSNFAPYPITLKGVLWP